MKNPIGPYPGRQLFLGLTRDGNPCLAYLVTGRSPESRERKALQMGSKVAIGPLGSVAYDPLRHYSAVQYENTSGVAAVSNGIQTEAVFETYYMLHNVNTAPAAEYLGMLLDGADAEPDTLHTPRIAGIITGHRDQVVCCLGIKRQNGPAMVFPAHLEPGVLTGIPTYNGELQEPRPFDPTAGLPTIKLEASTPESVAQTIFDASAASNKGQDIRVCTIGGVRSGQGWKVAIVNAH